MSIRELCTVAEAKPLQNGLYHLTIHAPQLTAQARAGQFVHIACGEGNMLRRPISICDWQADMLRLVYQVKGAGTKWLSERKAGDTLDVLGTLGNGYDLSALGAKPVVIGGGIGVPPMLGTAKALAANGAQPCAILGFRHAGAVILEEDFRAVCQTYVTTDDGSYARHGFVSDVLKELDGVTGVAACGPKPMLRVIAQIADEKNIPCYVSLEERMGCGIGACLVCACALRGEDGETRYGHVCKDGPVFNAKEVVW